MPIRTVTKAVTMAIYASLSVCAASVVADANTTTYNVSSNTTTNAPAQLNGPTIVNLNGNSYSSYDVYGSTGDDLTVNGPGTITVQDGGVLPNLTVNNATVNVDPVNPANPYGSFFGNNLINSGTLSISSQNPTTNIINNNGADLFITSSINNTGTINVNKGGSLYLGYTLSGLPETISGNVGNVNVNSGTVFMNNMNNVSGNIHETGGMVSGYGTFNGNITNDGGSFFPGNNLTFVEPKNGVYYLPTELPNQMTINGNYVQNSASTYVAYIWPGNDQNTKLVVNGYATLAGTLAVTAEPSEELTLESGKAVSTVFSPSQTLAGTPPTNTGPQFTSGNYYTLLSAKYISGSFSKAVYVDNSNTKAESNTINGLTPYLAYGNQAWAKAIGNFGHLAGYDTSGAGAVVGYGFHMHNTDGHWVFGPAFSYGHNTIGSSYSNTSTNSYGFWLYGGWHQQSWKVAAVAGGGFTRNAETTALDSIDSQSNYSGSFWDLALRPSYWVRMASGLVLSPRVTLNYGSSYTSAFAQTFGPTNYSIGSAKYSVFTVSPVMLVGDKMNVGDVSVDPQVRVGLNENVGATPTFGLPHTQGTAEARLNVDEGKDLFGVLSWKYTYGGGQGYGYNTIMASARYLW